jgi:hypothetical protein
MPPKRPVRKAAVEAKAKFGAERNRTTRRGAAAASPEGIASGKDEEDPEELPDKNVQEDMKPDEAVVDPADAKDAKGERQNEGEASTAPVPEKVIVHSLPQTHPRASL